MPLFFMLPPQGCCMNFPVFYRPTIGSVSTSPTISPRGMGGTHCRRSIPDQTGIFQLALHANTAAPPSSSNGGGAPPSSAQNGNDAGLLPSPVRNLAPVQHVVSSAVEHPAITKCLDHLAAEGRVEVTYVGVDGEGRVSAEEVVAALRPETALVTIMHSNNEVLLSSSVTPCFSQCDGNDRAALNVFRRISRGCEQEI